MLAAVAMLAGCQNRKSNTDPTTDEEQVAEKQALPDALKLTEQELAQVDSTLEAVKREHDSLYQWVMDHATQLNEQSAEVERLTQLRTTIDSLKVRFDVLCHRIKVIHREQKEK